MTKDGSIPDWPFVIGALAFAIVGWLTIIRRPKWFPDDFRQLGGAFAFLGPLFVVFGVAMVVLPRIALSNDLLSGDAQSVEGVITNFDPGRVSCHSSESFDVAKAHFAYSDYQITGGFNHTSTCGHGPFRAGQFVRLTYGRWAGDNVILRAAIWQ